MCSGWRLPFRLLACVQGVGEGRCLAWINAMIFFFLCKADNWLSKASTHVSRSFSLLFETGFVRRRQGNNWIDSIFSANCENRAITLPGVADWTSMDFAGMNSKASITALMLNVAYDGGRIGFCLMYSLCLNRLQTSVTGLSDSLIMCLL